MFGTVFSFFLMSLVLDVAVIFVGPFLVLICTALAITVTIRGLRLAWPNRQRKLFAVIVGGSGFLAAALAILLIPPASQAGNYGQAQLVLAFNLEKYQADLGRSPASLRVARHQPVIWSYGGWLSIDRDIVYDRLGAPSIRLQREYGRNASADCRWLRSYYYDCTVSF